MSRIRVTKVIAVSLLLTLTSLLSFTGCSQNPVEPVVDSGNDPVVLSRVARGATGALQSPVNLYIEAWISAEQGGQLVLLDVVLDIPPGAVKNDTLFSIFIPDDELFINEFGSEGLVFDEPVTVTMSYRGADLSGVDEQTIRVGYRNEVTGEWEDINCQVDQDNKVVIAQLHHFSAYGLISDEPSSATE
ncbi:hypothetical protein GF377_01185 [candidate division GN15 bacterium]|nr:hypothetical protein [candidate division GN15 bacterium]